MKVINGGRYPDVTKRKSKRLRARSSSSIRFVHAQEIDITWELKKSRGPYHWEDTVPAHLSQSSRPDATYSKSALGTAVRSAIGVAMVHRCLKRVVMCMHPGQLMDSIDAEILGAASVAGQCLQV